MQGRCLSLDVFLRSSALAFAEKLLLLSVLVKTVRQSFCSGARYYWKFSVEIFSAANHDFDE